MIKTYYKGVEVSVLKKLMDEHKLPCDYEFAWNLYMQINEIFVGGLDDMLEKIKYDQTS